MKSAFKDMPDESFIKISEIVQSKSSPHAPLPVSSNCVHRWVRLGLFPKPIRLGQNTAVWKVGAVRAWIDRHAESSESEASK